MYFIFLLPLHITEQLHLVPCIIFFILHSDFIRTSFNKKVYEKGFTNVSSLLILQDPIISYHIISPISCRYSTILSIPFTHTHPHLPFPISLWFFFNCGICWSIAIVSHRHFNPRLLNYPSYSLSIIDKSLTDLPNNHHQPQPSTVAQRKKNIKKKKEKKSKKY